MFSKFKSKNMEKRRNDEKLYAFVASEMEQGIRNDALWLKSLEQANGNTERQVALYIKLRIQAMKDELDSIQKEVARKSKFLEAFPQNPPKSVLGSSGSLRYWLGQQSSKYVKLTDSELHELLIEYRG